MQTLRRLLQSRRDKGTGRLGQTTQHEDGVLDRTLAGSDDTVMVTMTKDSEKETRDWKLIEAFYFGETVDLKSGEINVAGSPRLGKKRLWPREQHRPEVSFILGLDKNALEKTPHTTQIAFPTTSHTTSYQYAPHLTDETKIKFRELMHPEKGEYKRVDQQKVAGSTRELPFTYFSQLCSQRLMHWGFNPVLDHNNQMSLAYEFPEGAPGIDSVKDPARKNPALYDGADHHHYKTMSRFIESVSLAGYPQWAAAFFDALFGNNIWQTLPEKTQNHFLDKMQRKYHDCDAAPVDHIQNNSAKTCITNADVSLSVDPETNEQDLFYPAEAGSDEATAPASTTASLNPDAAQEAADLADRQPAKGGASITLPETASASRVALFSSLGKNAKAEADDYWKEFKGLPPVERALIVIGVLAIVSALITLFTVPSFPASHSIAISLRVLIPVTLGTTGGANLLAVAGLHRRRQSQSGETDGRSPSLKTNEA